MINAIAKIGEYEIQKNPELDNLDLILDDAFDGGKNKHLFVIVFRKNQTWEYDTVTYFDLNSSYKSKILYKRGSSKGTDFTPTTKITELKGKTFPNKILKWFEQQNDNTNLTEGENQFLSIIRELLQENSSKVIEDIQNKIEEQKDKTGSVLTVGFLENQDNLKFIGDYDFFKKFLIEEATRDYKYSKTNKVFSFASDNVCSICNSQKDEVFGFFTDLKFYNVDKQGMISGGFQYDAAWKNYPVCGDCALNIRFGYSYLQSNFNFLFYGLRYVFIPKISNSAIYEDVIESLKSYREQTFGIKDVERITNDENELFIYLKDQKSNISFDLFFYDQPQKSVLRILMLVEDVLPSRITCLFEIKNELDKIVFFKEAKSKEDKPLCYFNLGIIRNFFPNTKFEGNKDKYFLEITEKVFKNKPVDYQFIVQNIMKKIKTKFANDESVWLDTLKGFMLVLFLMKLKLVKYNSEENVDTTFFNEFKINKKEEIEAKINRFFENFREFFRNDAYRATFLLGVLTQFLLNIQKNERGAAPFRSKLKGLKMNAYDVSILLPEIIEKLEQYDKNFYRPLEELISKLLLSAGNYKNWRIPIDELNFIFVLGMNLSKYFKIKEDEKQEVHHD